VTDPEKQRYYPGAQSASGDDYTMRFVDLAIRLYEAL
jgi:hypothetical protein